MSKGYLIILFTCITACIMQISVYGQHDSLQAMLQHKKTHHAALQGLADYYIRHDNFRQANLYLKEGITKYHDTGFQITLASNYIQQQYADSAIAICQQLQPRLTNPIEKVKVYRLMAAGFKLNNSFSKACQVLNDALDIIKANQLHTMLPEQFNLMGSMFWQQGEITLAKNYYDSALLVLHPDSVSDKITVLNNKALCLKDEGKFMEAYNTYRHTIDLSVQTLNKAQLAESYNYMGNVFYRQNKYDSAVYYYHQSLYVHSQSKNKNAKVSAYINLANTLQKMLQYDSARYYNKAAYTLATAAEDKYQQISTLNNLGVIEKETGQYAVAAHYFYKALDIAHLLNNTYILAQTCNRIAQFYTDINNFPKALRFLQLSVSYTQQLGNQATLSYRLHQLGNLYFNHTDYVSAQGYYLNALDIREKMHDEAACAQTLNALGNTYRELENYSRALDYYTRALQRNQQAGNIIQQAYNLNNLGNVYLRMEHNEKAINYFMQAYNKSQTAGSKFIQALTARKLGEIYTSSQQYDKAYKYLNESLEIGREVNHNLMVQNAYKGLYNLESAKGNYKKAIQYHQKFYHTEKDAIAKANNRKIFETQLNYELDVKSDSIALIEDKLLASEQEKKLKTLEAQKYKNQRSLLLAIIVITIGGVASVLYLFLKLKKINRQLDKAYADVAQSNLKLKKSETILKELNATKDKFFSIIGHDLRGPISGLVNLTSLLNENRETLTIGELIEANQSINISAKQLYGLTENLLQWSRSQTGRVNYKPAMHSFYQLVHETLQLLKISANKKNITLINEVPEHVMAWFDTDMIQTVIRNLVNNSIKFTPEGGKITVFAQSNNGQLEVAVIDTGVGMSPEVRDKLFKIDEHVSSLGTNNEKGTGLGLVICAEFIKKHGSTIHVSSRENKGSEFKFHLQKNANNG